MGKYVIVDDNDGMMLSSINLTRVFGSCMSSERKWTVNYQDALQFELAEETEAVITFISDVIDWELAQQLYVKLLEL